MNAFTNFTNIDDSLLAPWLPLVSVVSRFRVEQFANAVPFKLFPLSFRLREPVSNGKQRRWIDPHPEMTGDDFDIFSDGRLCFEGAFPGNDPV